MPKAQRTVAIYPGAFDPITNGHLDLLRRAEPLFDHLIVAIGHNPEKEELFSAQERVEMIAELLTDLEDVTVQAYQGLTVNFARSVGARVILRGIRGYTDLHHELLSAGTNLAVGGIETVFLTASMQHDMTSSSLVKQIVEIGGYEPERLERLVPSIVVERLRRKLKRG